MYGLRTLMAHGQTTARRRTTLAQEKPKAGAARTVKSGAASSKARRAARRSPVMMRFLLVHPNADPAVITREIGMLPSRAWRQGEPRYTPKGTSLEGTWRDTRWGHNFTLHRNATIETAIALALDKLSAAKPLIATLRDTGGSAELIISLPGDTYQGASVSTEQLKVLADLGVSLGLEVFP